MSAVYPHRKMNFVPTIAPDAHLGAVTGEWVDMYNLPDENAIFKITATTLAAAVDFTFETTIEDPATPGTALEASAEQMGNCAICDDSVSFADATLTIDPTLEPFVTDGQQVTAIGVCCPKRFVRAKSDGAGNYYVEVIGRARSLDRI